MGASDFHDVERVGDVADRKDARRAFLAAVQAAQYEDGHGGYTGTIAEKPGISLFPGDGRDLGALAPAQVIEGALSGQEEDAAALLAADPGLARELRDAQAQYNDTWGDALCFRHGAEWHFCGMASE